MPLPGEVLDASAVDGRTIEIPSGAGTIDAYLARPARQAAARPGVIVIHEAFGPVAHIQDVARRFANIGLDAVAPNLYAREGPPVPGDMESLVAKMFAIPDERAESDLEASARYLRGLQTATGKVGCIGFCAGGRHALLLACRSTDVDAVVDCWGGQIDRATPDHLVTTERPVPVLDLLVDVSCPLLLVGGAEDTNPTPSVLELARERLLAAGKDVTLEIFEGAGHAFFADYRPSYRDGSAHRLWPMVVEFFKANLS